MNRVFSLIAATIIGNTLGSDNNEPEPKYLKPNTRSTSEKAFLDKLRKAEHILINHMPVDDYNVETAGVTLYVGGRGLWLGFDEIQWGKWQGTNRISEIECKTLCTKVSVTFR